jgi:hypothetical protein
MTFKVRECIHYLVFFVHYIPLRQQRHRVIFVVGIVLALLRSENIAVRLLRSAYLGHIL